MMPGPQGAPAENGRSIVAVRERMEALGQVSAELLHDLADAAYSLEQRALLAAEDARHGRSPLPELQRTVEAGTEMRAMLRDVMEVLRGAALSPEVTYDPRDTVERAVRRFLPCSGPQVEVRLVCDLPPGTMVPGRESFLARLTANLLAGAARRARTRVLLELRTEDGAGRPRLRGAGGGGRRPRRRAAPAPRRAAVTGEDEWRPGVVAWLVSQMGGEVRQRLVCVLGGSGIEIRLPANVP